MAAIHIAIRGRRVEVRDERPVKDAASDPVKLTVPLLIRLLEFAREETPKGDGGDVELHRMVERLTRSGDDVLGMDAYEPAVNGLKTVETKDAQIHAAGVLFVKNGNALFLRRTDEGDKSGMWALPGGKLEQGETSIEAARRECQEEIGLDPGPDLKSIRIENTPGVLYETFGVKVERQFPPTLNEEHDDYVWAPMDQPPEPLHPGVQRLLEQGRAEATKDAFSEADHPRGHEAGNAGQFVAKGSGVAVSATAHTETEHKAEATGKAAEERASASKSEAAVQRSRNYASNLSASVVNARKEAHFERQPSSIEHAMTAAAANQPKLEKAGRQIANITGATFRTAGAKSLRSLKAKVEEQGKPVRRISDIVRGGFEVSEAKQADKAIRLLQHSDHFAEVIDEGWSKTAAGYFDRTAIVVFKDGQMGEVQFWSPGMLDAKEGEGRGHEMYVEMKTLPRGDPRRGELAEKMNALYGGVQKKNAETDPEWESTISQMPLRDRASLGDRASRSWATCRGSLLRSEAGPS